MSKVQSWPAMRKKALDRDKYVCQECEGTEGLQVHHITPRYEGGTDELANLRTMCLPCHTEVHRQLDKVYWDNRQEYEREFKILLDDEGLPGPNPSDNWQVFFKKWPSQP